MTKYLATLMLSVSVTASAMVYSTQVMAADVPVVGLCQVTPAFGPRAPGSIRKSAPGKAYTQTQSGHVELEACRIAAQRSANFELMVYDPSTAEVWRIQKAYMSFSAEDLNITQVFHRTEK